MNGKQLPTLGDKSFEAIKQTNEHGAEYWSARDLQSLLGYSQWRRFEQAIERAMTSCERSGNRPDHHFAGAGKMVDIGSGSQREVDDYHLSRFACYLIAQNGDPRQAGNRPGPEVFRRPGPPAGAMRAGRAFDRWTAARRGSAQRIA